jgi:hypothetical protein
MDQQTVFLVAVFLVALAGYIYVRIRRVSKKDKK